VKGKENGTSLQNLESEIMKREPNNKTKNVAVSEGWSGAVNSLKASDKHFAAQVREWKENLSTELRVHKGKRKGHIETKLRVHKAKRKRNIATKLRVYTRIKEREPLQQGP
jgi:hypothetical protein